jgi:1-aminocyclopropane-1-carboxylate deaminase/D-cysteine desulfhydrase-like pyridoxal-dependent ACC family enzyme
MSRNPLFQALPHLAGAIPWLELGAWPTPVSRLAHPLPGRGGELWVKRDDLSSPVYGGNKVRKLEYVLADARRAGAGRLITSGVVGSHHCLATAVHGHRLGLPTSLVLLRQPMTPHAREVAALNHAWADDVRFCSTFAALPFVEAGLRWRRRAERPYVIPPGGSSALGALGYVGAALELAQQIRRGEAPRPETVVVAAGTLGTVAGLALGAALTDLADRVLAVRIVPSAVANIWSLSRLVEGVVRLLADAGAAAPDARAVVDRVVLVSGYLGSGYGHPTEEGERAAARFAELGLPLDPSYTAKTAAALLDRLAAGEDRVTLYWHTLSAVRPPARPPGAAPAYPER